jgi:acyl-CoA thioester hydrolase
MTTPSTTSTPSTRPSAPQRSAYAAFVPITTRWADNDVYGHVNNVVFYSWFDTAVNSYLIAHGALDIAQGSTIGLVVETQCHYFAPVCFPQAVTVGLRVAHRGTSSVRYDLAVFAGDASVASACGHFVHVYVDKATRRPSALPDNLISVLETLT